MPDVYVSEIDFGDGIVRKLKAEGGGMYIGDVTSFNAAVSAGVKKVTLTWGDPDDIVIGGVTQVEWGGTVIVRKAGSIPASSGDGTVIVDNKVRDQYSTNGFEDINVDFDTVYYYRAFPYTTSGQSTAGSSLTVEIVTVQIYGAEWDGTSTTAWTRTDASQSFVDPVSYVAGASSYSSPFDNIMPWSGMTVEERTGGTMVKIPKFWYKLTQNGNALKIQITSNASDGFSVSPAHMDRGDGNGERDYAYIGRYHCSSTNYKSTTGKTPKGKITRSTARTNIHNLGANIWQSDFAMRFTIWLLYIVEFADWDSQTKIGYGCGSSSDPAAVGYTDSMPYHTGTTQSSRTDYGLGIQYRNIEGLWDDVVEWCDGCYYNGLGLNIILNPNNFSDSSGGILVGLPSSGAPSKFTLEDVSGTFVMFIPTEANGGSSTYSCDTWTYNGANSCLGVGGMYLGKNYGLFHVESASNSYTAYNQGCRLMELP